MLVALILQLSLDNNERLICLEINICTSRILDTRILSKDRAKGTCWGWRC